MKFKELAKKYLETAVERGGLILFPPESALGVVQKCSELAIPVLGIDGFNITVNTTQPDLENSIDCSAFEEDTTYVKTIEFLNSRIDSNLYFEIICDM